MPCWRSIRTAARSSASTLGGAPHWIAVSHDTGRLFASFKTKEAVAVVDLNSRHMTGNIAIPHGAEGIAVSPDGETLFVCAHWQGVVHVFDTRTLAHRQTIAIEGAPGEVNQLRRVRVSPDGRYVCASSHVDNFAAVYEADTLKQIGGFATPKAPMGFGFAADGRHAFLCCHDAAVTLEFELAERPYHAAIRNRGGMRVRDFLLMSFPLKRVLSIPCLFAS